MPSPAKAAMAAEASSVTSFGQVIEYIENRIYLASYTHAPDENTPFPYPSTKRSRSPNKRSARAQAGPQPVQTPDAAASPVYISVDRSLLYNAFHADFGPLHIGHLYRFAVQLHDALSYCEVDHRPVVLWSSPDARNRANAACVLACYMVLIQNWPPHLALAPISQMDPPCMPFRDAGYSQADYSLTVQDVVYGVWKAKEQGLVGLKEFSLEEYEKYERVDMGDFNWITPDFLAFASPQHKPTHPILPGDPLYNQLPRSLAALETDKTLPTPFKNVLSHFHERSIGLVVRLNSELYSPTYFTAMGIHHLDMIFDDGTCPTLKIVRKFVNLAHTMINDKHKGIAVHCKAGLGRTGCLIGAYLIYRYGFTANEVIAFMRFMRPGMVVGPQQHWLHLNQGTFREWWFEDTIKAQMLASLQPSTPTKVQTPLSKKLISNGQTFTPPNGDRQTSPRRAALGEITNNEQGGMSQVYVDDMKCSKGVADENLPAPTPGQPRKTSKIYGGRRTMTENKSYEERQMASMKQSKGCTGNESEEDYALQMMTRKSQSPLSRSGKRRAVSCITTTTTTTKWDVPSDISDEENRPLSADESDAAMLDRLESPTRPKTPATKSGSGLGSLTVGKRSSPLRRSTEGKTSIRKTSGRVGSVGARVHRVS